MLKTHLQPIVAYFFNQSISSSKVVGATTNVRDSHLQPAIDRLIDTKRADVHPPQQSSSKPSLGQIWRSIIRINPDPRIKQRFDRSGQPYWQAYDPIVDQVHFFFSEGDVYQWLERRYYE